MVDRPTLAINLARQAADCLAAHGDHKRAEDVRALIRSNTALRIRLKQLQSENMLMRAIQKGEGDGLVDRFTPTRLALRAGQKGEGDHV